MPNQYTPEKRTIGNLLSTTNPAIVVPDWQRSYSWTRTEIEPFWNDLVAFSESYPGENVRGQEYFLGSIVIVDANDEHLLLDGQQRLSTAAVLLSIIRDYLGRYNQNAAIRTQSRYLGDFDDARNEYAYKITMNEYDRNYFKRQILETRNAAFTEPEALLESHRLIQKARNYFGGKFDEAYERFSNTDAYQWTLRIQDVLTNHMSVVAIFSQDEDNAATVFETLNDRGIGLSTTDLVRNLILRRSEEGTREEIIDLWLEVLQIESDAPLKAFLRHFWISRYGDVKTQSLFREIKSTITNQEINSLELSRTLRDSANVYHEIISGSSDSEVASQHFCDAVDLGANILLPLLLSICETFETENHAPSAEAVLNTFVRHSVVGKLENSRMENVVYRLAREVRQGVSKNQLVQQLREFAPSNEEFTRAFSRVSIPRRATARYVLRKLELDRRNTEELNVAAPSRVHVEHIYPQTPITGRRLEQHGQIIDRIGNLTLLSGRINRAIRNSVFEEKVPFYRESELLLTRELTEFDHWSSQEIVERQRILAERAPEIWAV